MTTDESTFWRVLAVVRQVFAVVLIALPAGTLLWLLLGEPHAGRLEQAPLLLLAAAPILATRQRTAGLIALLLGAIAAAGAAVEGFSGLTDYFNACSGHRADDIATFFAISCIPALLGGVLVTAASAGPVRRFLRG